MPRFHSRTFAVITRIALDLSTATWPEHPVTGRQPIIVGPGEGLLPEDADEWVDVLYRIEDDATIDWKRVSPGGRDETFLVDIEIGSNVLGQDRTKAWERLEDLAAVVQGNFYNPDAVGPSGNIPIDDDSQGWNTNLGGVVRVAPRMWPDGEGYVGQCTVTVKVTVRI